MDEKARLAVCILDEIAGSNIGGKICVMRETIYLLLNLKMKLLGWI